MRGLEVRPARLDEIESCADLYVRVLRDTFTWLPAERHRRDDFLAAAREEEIYIATEGGRIVGLAALYRPQHFLHSLYVVDRGRGIGKLLLDYVEDMAGAPLSLKVQKANSRARPSTPAKASSQSAKAMTATSRGSGWFVRDSPAIRSFPRKRESTQSPTRRRF